MKNWIIWTIVIVILGVSIILYARYIGTTGIKVKEYRVYNEKLTDDYYGLKIVHISDIHYGRIYNAKNLQKLVNKINELKPNIVVITGDLIDQYTKLTPATTDELINTLSKITNTALKYAITGNHDRFFDNWGTIITESGFTNLNDSYDTIYYNSNDFLTISGLSQNTESTLTVEDKIKPIYEYLDSFNDKNKEEIIQKPLYNILLMHEPDFIDNIDLTKFDLVLAGHSHNGQINIPYLKKLYLPIHGQKYYENYYSINNTDIYISSGIGVSTVNFRLFERPSINLYRLTNKV